MKSILDAVGMYKVGDKKYPKVKVGKFTICRQDEVSVWIQADESGEGGQFSDALFGDVVAAFYDKHF